MEGEYSLHSSKLNREVSVKETVCACLRTFRPIQSAKAPMGKEKRSIPSMTQELKIPFKLAFPHTRSKRVAKDEVTTDWSKTRSSGPQVSTTGPPSSILLSLKL